MAMANKQLSKHHIPGPLGVRGRNSDNRLIVKELGWRPTQPLEQGLEKTYRWIDEQVQQVEKKKQGKVGGKNLHERLGKILSAAPQKS